MLVNSLVDSEVQILQVVVKRQMDYVINQGTARFDNLSLV